MLDTYGLGACPHWINIHTSTLESGKMSSKIDTPSKNNGRNIYPR